MSFPPPPSLLALNVNNTTTTASANNNNEDTHTTPFSNLKPSILIIVLILSITILISVSLCLLLRHLNHRCLRHLSSSTTNVTNTSSTSSSRHHHHHHHNHNRVTPETPTFSIVDSLPLFTFNTIKRRYSSSSSTVVSGDCAVCLSKFEPDDQLRLLPLCCHAFHASCIDTWIESNQTCPLCRSPIIASDSDIIKALLLSTANNGGDAVGGGRVDSFRLEIGSISRRQSEQPGSVAAEPPRRSSYSVGSFEYVVEDESEIAVSQVDRRSVSDKESAMVMEEPPSLVAEVASGRSWLKEYVDRLSSSLSSRALSFRSSGRFFTGSSRRSEIAAGDFDLEANRVGEEISELFRWVSGV